MPIFFPKVATNIILQETTATILAQQEQFLRFTALIKVEV